MYIISAIYFFHILLGHYIRVWLAILNTEFMLSYLDRQDDNTKYMEDVVLYEV